MTKLSAAQEKVLRDAKANIDKARNQTFEEWLPMPMDRYSPEKLEWWKDQYERERSGIALAYCNTKTIKKLESLGLIEIVYDSTGETFGLDEIKVLGY